jgi:hypothetical protein
MISLLLMPILCTACATSNMKRQADLTDQGPKATSEFAECQESWTNYPIIAHKLRSEEAPIVRWIDTDGDGISNYRLLCTFENGRVQVKSALPDTSFRPKFMQVKQ